MFPIDSIELLLLRCNSPDWYGRFSTKIRLNHRMLRIYRWEHKVAKLGFVLCLVQTGDKLTGEELREFVQYFHHWKGKNLGVLFILSHGMLPKSEHALPYYGHLRCAVIDLEQERIHHGTDSKKFQLVVNCIARELGIPCGGEIDYWVQSQHYNRLGPVLWTRIQLQRYALEDLTSWHPLFIACCFQNTLRLGLNNTLHYRDQVFIVHPLELPIGSSHLRSWKQLYSKRSIVLLHRSRLTTRAVEVSSQLRIECHFVDDPIPFLQNRLGTDSIHRDASSLYEICKEGKWSPLLWASYHQSISKRSSHQRHKDIFIFNDGEYYLSVESLPSLLENIRDIPTAITFVLHTNFHVPQELLARFHRWVWFYRDEVYGASQIPSAVVNAFCHFNSVNPIYRSRKERFLERADKSIVDRWTGRTVEFIEDFPKDYVRLRLGFLLSMHISSASYLCYYPQEEILVQEQVTGNLDWRLENVYEWHAVLEAMYLMGLKNIHGEFGKRDEHLVFSIGQETPALKCWAKIPQSLLEAYPYQAELAELQQKII